MTAKVSFGQKRLIESIEEGVNATRASDNNTSGSSFNAENIRKGVLQRFYDKSLFDKSPIRDQLYKIF